MGPCTDAATGMGTLGINIVVITASYNEWGICGITVQKRVNQSICRLVGQINQMWL